ncbi:B3 domain-containing protein [Senna tora]|uniref:B3 domain-containing protein n=1 Tax=Senna tora TaxID=362788 RepID=A0A834XAE5_9FABA|nr:B3 domain-containing protein [Senna tora]
MAIVQNPNKRHRPSSPTPPMVKRGKMVKMVIANIDSQASANERAKEVQANLPLKFPSFTKLMLPSHVYIVRHDCPNEVDIALSLLDLEGSMKHHDSVENDPNNVPMICDANQPDDQTIEDDEDLGSEILGGIRLSESTITFQQVTSIENFNIIVNGLVIDSELSQHLKTKYYELCSSQRMFLHENLLEGLNCKLVSGIICETINIADAIRASKITSPPGGFTIWSKTLKAFEAMGMNIGFLLARLDQLMGLASKSRRYEEARLERDRAEEERKVLEARIAEVKEIIDRLNGEIENSNMNFEKLEVVFQELAKSPW